MSPGARAVLTCLLALAAAAPAAVADVDGELAVAPWEGTLLSRRVGGAVAVLAGPEGSLRWEIAAAPDTALADLLERRGRGWTVVVAAGGAGTRNAWAEEWRPLEPDLARALAAATGAVLAGRGPGRTIVAGPPGDLRTRLARRGTGRGGPGEILRIAPDGDGGRRLASSRRPGTLRLGAWRRHAVRYPVRESFTPLWPLAELLEFRSENGNPGG